jgi:trans-2,3-dihydro-3-hydroxyanthranilate isomerase
VSRPYLHIDVFTDRPFSGNQLAVFPDARGLSDERMQALANEMAFSETTFVLPPEEPDVDFRVRIFTPATELPMAGHPTIGTTFALAHLGRISPTQHRVVLGLGVGPTEVRLDDRLRFAWMTQRAPDFGPPLTDSVGLARALGVADDEIASTQLPAQIVSSGTPFLLVPMASHAAVDRVTLDRAAYRSLLDASGIPEAPVYVFSVSRPAGDTDPVTTYSRMFAPTFGIVEDPATGGACGPLGGYLVHHGVVTATQAARVTNLQGVAMGRPSRMSIAVSMDGDAVVDVRVGGEAVLVGEGVMRIDP